MNVLVGHVHLVARPAACETRPLDTADYEEAAAAFNRCRERGIQGSNTDFLICAAALRRDLSIYTTDGDFKHYARVLKLELHTPRS